MILLDTHVLLWWMAGEARLDAAEVWAIERARGEGGVMISAMSFWEVAMLCRKERLALPKPVGEWAQQVLASPGIRLAEITPHIAIDAGTLPNAVRGDPGDRIIMATARILGIPLFTHDEAIRDYARQGYLTVVDASR